MYRRRTYFYRPIIFRQTALSLVTFLLRWLDGCFLCPIARDNAVCTFQPLCLVHVPCLLQAFETQDGLLWVTGLANVYIYQMTSSCSPGKMVFPPASALPLLTLRSVPSGGDRGSIVVPCQLSCLFANFIYSPWKHLSRLPIFRAQVVHLLLLTCENFAYNLGGNPLSSSGGTGLASLWLTLRCSCCAWWTETFSCNVIVFVQWVSRLGILLTQSFPAPGTERPLLYFSGRELKRCPHVCLYSMKTGVLWEVWSEDPNSGFPAGYWMSLTFPAGGNTTFVIYQTCTYMWVHF